MYWLIVYTKIAEESVYVYLNKLGMLVERAMHCSVYIQPADYVTYARYNCSMIWL